jgi:nucleotide-binding universal stress UspA family protein
VIGSRGRTGIEKFLLGSVAEKVVLQSSIPVLMIKGEAD